MDGLPASLPCRALSTLLFQRGCWDFFFLFSTIIIIIILIIIGMNSTIRILSRTNIDIDWLVSLQFGISHSYDHHLPHHLFSIELSTTCLRFPKISTEHALAQSAWTGARLPDCVDK